ncbi:MAG: hypothetical protein COB67_06680 [SAR324 cluster bacterium]|uniref:Carboxypeptidase regulatory-like domain-containing protein n=1 Tax=SAR324 cluster bacterium TaxID=2024889 RepID=A0A2A4T3U9_9DELT|nr:MAG: hypothetical protein COB67_06680 [SAR324 cluster bacterium]
MKPFRTSYGIYWSLFILLYSFFLPPRVFPQEQGLLNQAYIQFQIKKKGSTFYSVLMGPEEQPYLDVLDIMETYLSLFPHCHSEKLTCRVKIFILQKEYLIDGVTGQFGVLENENSIKFLPSEAFIVQDGKFWLRYDIWGQWLPLSLTWNLDLYQLNMVPHFPLLSEITQQRAQVRDKNRELKLANDYKDSLPSLRATQDYAMEFRYLLSHERLQKKTQENTNLNYDFNLDLWEGTFQWNGTYGIQKQAEKTVHQQTGFWNYKILHQPYFESLEVGTTFLDRTVLVPNLRLNDGFRLHRLGEKVGAERFILRGITFPGTEVDVYRNGFLLESKITGGDGVYIFDNINIAGGESVRLQFFYPDGSSEEELFKIAPDYGAILSEDVWDMRLNYGKKDTTRIYHLDLAWGLLENLSLGATVYQFREATENEEKIEKLHGITVAWRPFYGLHLQGEGLLFESGRDYGLQVDLTYFRRHFIQWTSRVHQEASPLLDFYAGDRRSLRFDQLRHNFSWGRWFWGTDCLQSIEKQKCKFNLRHQWSARLSFSVEPEFVHPFEGEDTRSSNWEVDLLWPKHSVRISRLISKDNSRYTGSYRFQRGKKANWDFSLALNLPDQRENSFSATLSWRPTEQISTKFNGRTDDNSIYAAWADVITKGQGAQNWNQFGSGTLSGYVIMPEGENEVMPLAGIVVQAGSRKGITDQEGHYVIHGLPVDQRLSVRIDPGSLDVGLGVDENLKIVTLRPGTRITYNPKIIRTVGLDGVVEHKDALPVGIKIIVIRFHDQQRIQKISIEKDGFFVIENLKPGDYFLKLEGGRTSPPPKMIRVRKEDFWLSNIKIRGF